MLRVFDIELKIVLGCYPCAGEDPFAMDETPHVYFAANQAEYATALVEGPQQQTVRLLCIPDFASTGTIVAVNLKDLCAFPIHFTLY